MAKHHAKIERRRVRVRMREPDIRSFFFFFFLAICVVSVVVVVVVSYPESFAGRCDPQLLLHHFFGLLRTHTREWL
jgi:ABC-type lipoprotein release transport system permease subunit